MRIDEHVRRALRRPQPLDRGELGVRILRVVRGQSHVLRVGNRQDRSLNRVSRALCFALSIFFALAAFFVAIDQCLVGSWVAATRTQRVPIVSRARTHGCETNVLPVKAGVLLTRGGGLR